MNYIKDFEFHKMWDRYDLAWHDLHEDVNVLVGINGKGKTTLLDAINSYYNKLLELLVNQTIQVFDEKSKDNLIHTLQKWYKKQSDSAKNGLQDSTVTSFMNVIKSIDTFDETEVVQRIAKVVSGVYVDAWDDMKSSGIVNVYEVICRIVVFGKFREFTVDIDTVHCVLLRDKQFALVAELILNVAEDLTRARTASVLCLAGQFN